MSKPLTREQVAEELHILYLAKAHQLGWTVRTECNVPYNQLSENGKALDLMFADWHLLRTSALRAQPARLLEEISKWREMYDTTTKQLAQVTAERDRLQDEWQLVSKLDGNLDYVLEYVKLQHQLAEAQETLKRHETVLQGDALVEELHYEPGKPLDLILSHPLIASIASSMADLLDKSKADNYLECSMNNQAGSKFIMTIQRAEKPTPHELRREAEKQRDQALVRIKELENK